MQMNNLVNKCTNANVYLNGVSYMGRAEEITLPDISPKMVDHKALGMVGELELPAGLQKMSAKIKWNAIYPDVMKMTHNAFQAVRLQIRANIETYQGGTRTNQQPAVIYLTGTWKKSGAMSFKPQDNVEIENELSVTAYKMEVNGDEIINIDVMSNIWRVNGVDQLGQYRTNLGL
jgi:P2 family phage contractile tail tube protein